MPKMDTTTLGRRAALLGIAALAMPASGLAHPSAARIFHRRAPSRFAPVASCIVVDANGGRVLFSDNADAPIRPASLAKMMTLHILFASMDAGIVSPNDGIRFSRRAAARPNTKLGLTAGSILAVEDAVHALAVHSCNDVATAVSESLASTEEAFAAAMTSEAERLGCRGTKFANASGLPDVGNVSTARDLARIGGALVLRHPAHLADLGIREWSYGGRTFENTSKLLGAYPGLDATKTGFINESRFNLFASAQRGGRRLFAVVTGGHTSATCNESMRLALDAGFATA